MRYEAMARKHWKKYLPEKYQALEEAGILEEVLEEEATAARAELAEMVSNGAQQMAAEEIVLKEYILLPPE